MSDLHLSPSELAGWRDRGAGDRDRIVGHLAACAACRHAAAELERERPLDAGTQPGRFIARDFVAAGLRAGGQATPVSSPPAFAKATAGRQALRSSGPPSHRPQRVPRGVFYLAAAASLVLAVFLVPRWLGDRSSPVVRGGSGAVVPVAPVDATVALDSLAFEWTADPAVGPLRLVVVSLDDAGAPVIDREVTGTDYEPTADERRRLRSGREYHWFVEYRGTGGGTSAAVRFRVR